ncbi:MAG: hypothetical protein WDO18_19025 [Acidobacteriota bacterium]
MRGTRSDVLNPSVVRFRDAYWNFYSEYDGKAWHTAAATSPDGVTWTDLGPVLSPRAEDGTYIAANGSALVVGEEIFYWYEVGYPLRIALARSRDGRNWTREPRISLQPDPTAASTNVLWPTPTSSRPSTISTCITWAKIAPSPAPRHREIPRRHRVGETPREPRHRWSAGSLDEDLGEPAVWNSGGEWWMLYTGRARTEQRRLGLARSPDGVQWTRVPDSIIAGTETLELRRDLRPHCRAATRRLRSRVVRWPAILPGPIKPSMGKSASAFLSR